MNQGESIAIRREDEVVKSTTGNPVTVNSLIQDLTNLGIERRMTLLVLVHSSLRSLGWVCGGQVAVILALEEILGPEGTLVMPTHSTDLSEPSEWKHPPVPSSWRQAIREETPAFLPDLTPTRLMGAIPECFRKQDSVLRSSHPQVSFAARGKNAEFVMRDHRNDFPLGEKSPLARIYDLDGYVLLLGVNHSNNTSIHLAEYRAKYPTKKIVTNGAPIFVNGKRQWIELRDINGTDSDFDRIGIDFENTVGSIAIGIIGSSARTSLMRQRELVDFAVRWIETNRK